VCVFYSIYTYIIEGMNAKGTEKEGGPKGRGRTLWQILHKKEDTSAKFPPKGGHFGEISS
jgi:hypothetical protein